MNKTNSNTSNGIGFAGVLTIAFIVLKLTDLIDWSWWWVLSPVWISIILSLILIIIFYKFMMVIIIMFGIIGLSGSCSPQERMDENPCDIVKIDGCEYLIKYSSHYGGIFTHKGNCSNPIHTRIIHDTIIIKK